MFEELCLEAAFNLLGKNRPAGTEKLHGSSESNVRGEVGSAGSTSSEGAKLKTRGATNDAERPNQCYEKRNFI